MVYKYECRECKKIYIGRTSNRVVDRHDQHKRDVNKFNENSALTGHILNLDHHGLGDIEKEFQLSILSKHRDTPETIIAEARAIDRHKPELNRKKELSTWV